MSDQEPFLGQIAIFAFDKIPKGYIPCNGQTLSIQTNQALFTLLGTAYGGNGQTTFNVPNLQGAAPFSFGSDGLGNSYTVGQTGGEASHTLAQNEIPAHSHTLSATSNQGTTSSPSGAYLSAAQANGGGGLNMYGTTGANGTLAQSTVGTNGSSQGHENRMPFLAFSFCICTNGIYPSRS